MLVKEIKEFNELSTRDLYKILRLRSEVFVVEQNCVYQDLDGKDYQAFHMLGYHDNDLVAYTRIFKPGDYFKEVSIGRVVVSSIQRGSGFGYEIMKFSIDFATKNWSASGLRISAQTYLTRFYNNLGFQQVGQEYLEDGIPHINMVRNQIN